MLQQLGHEHHMCLTSHAYSIYKDRSITCAQHHTPTVYTECPRRNVRDFGRVFLMLNYTDITQNTYIQS